MTATCPCSGSFAAEGPAKPEILRIARKKGLPSRDGYGPHRADGDSTGASPWQIVDA